MGVVHIIDGPMLFPGRTPLLGETKGPVAVLGELIDGVHVYLSERESAEVTRAWGGKTKAEVEELLRTIEEQAATIKEQAEELQWHRPLIAACDDVYRKMRAGRPTPTPTPA